MGPLEEGWDHWRRLLKWSDKSIASLCKLTFGHVYPTESLKMRNSLAEVLHQDLLESMKIFALSEFASIDIYTKNRRTKFSCRKTSQIYISVLVLFPAEKNSVE